MQHEPRDTRARRVLEALRDATIRICGLTALVTPVLLWSAWSTTMFWWLIALGCAATLALCVLVATSRDAYF